MEQLHLSGLQNERSLAAKVAYLVATATVILGASACKPKACPAKFDDLASSMKDGTATCTCAASAATGSLWGSSTYTTDSSICAAAVHAGAIPATGGPSR